MIRLIRGAKLCAAESGTLTHNFLFAQEGKEVVIVERQVTINDYQCNVDVARGLKPIYVDANHEIYTTASRIWSLLPRLFYSLNWVHYF